jgi:hypothetical protein
MTNKSFMFNGPDSVWMLERESVYSYTHHTVVKDNKLIFFMSFLFLFSFCSGSDFFSYSLNNIVKILIYHTGGEHS